MSSLINEIRAQLIEAIKSNRIVFKVAIMRSIAKRFIFR